MEAAKEAWTRADEGNTRIYRYEGKRDGSTKRGEKMRVKVIFRDGFEKIIDNAEIDERLRLIKTRMGYSIKAPIASIIPFEAVKEIVLNPQERAYQEVEQ